MESPGTDFNRAFTTPMDMSQNPNLGNIDHLFPAEITQHILSFTPTKDTLSFLLVNKCWSITIFEQLKSEQLRRVIKIIRYVWQNLYNKSEEKKNCYEQMAQHSQGILQLKNLREVKGALMAVVDALAYDLKDYSWNKDIKNNKKFTEFTDFLKTQDVPGVEKLKEVLKMHRELLSAQEFKVQSNLYRDDVSNRIHRLLELGDLTGAERLVDNPYLPHKAFWKELIDRLQASVSCDFKEDSMLQDLPPHKELKKIIHNLCKNGYFEHALWVAGKSVDKDDLIKDVVLAYLARGLINPAIQSAGHMTSGCPAQIQSYRLITNALVLRGETEKAKQVAEMISDERIRSYRLFFLDLPWEEVDGYKKALAEIQRMMADSRFKSATEELFKGIFQDMLNDLIAHDQCEQALSAYELIPPVGQRESFPLLQKYLLDKKKFNLALEMIKKSPEDKQDQDTFNVIVAMLDYEPKAAVRLLGPIVENSKDTVFNYRAVLKVAEILIERRQIDLVLKGVIPIADTENTMAEILIKIADSYSDSKGCEIALKEAEETWGFGDSSFLGRIASILSERKNFSRALEVLNEVDKSDNAFGSNLEQIFHQLIENREYTMAWELIVKTIKEDEEGIEFYQELQLKFLSQLAEEGQHQLLLGFLSQLEDSEFKNNALKSLNLSV